MIQFVTTANGVTHRMSTTDTTLCGKVLEDGVRKDSAPRLGRCALCEDRSRWYQSIDDGERIKLLRVISQLAKLAMGMRKEQDEIERAGIDALEKAEGGRE